MNVMFLDSCEWKRESFVGDDKYSFDHKSRIFVFELRFKANDPISTNTGCFTVANFFATTFRTSGSP